MKLGTDAVDHDPGNILRYGATWNYIFFALIMSEKARVSSILTYKEKYTSDPDTFLLIAILGMVIGMKSSWIFLIYEFF